MTILQEPITEPIVVENFVGGEWIRSAGSTTTSWTPRDSASSPTSHLDSR